MLEARDDTTIVAVFTDLTNRKAGRLEEVNACLMGTDNSTKDKMEA